MDISNYASIGIAVDTRQLRNAESEVNRLGTTGGNVERKLNQNTKSMMDGFGGVTKAIHVATAALAAMGLTRFANEAIEYSDANKRVNNQLRQVTGSEIALMEVRKQLVGISKNTNTELQATIDLYSETFRATRDLATSQGEVARVTETVNNLFKAGGKSAAVTAGAIRQLTQGFASGVLRGDEFNSVAEGAPRILDAISKSTGIARGKLRDFAATGGITAQILVESLTAYHSEAQRLADLTEETFDQKMVNARTNVIEFANSMDSANGAIGALGDGIESLTENLDDVADAAALLILVFGARFAGPIIGSFAAVTASQIAYTNAALRGNVVTLSGVVAEKQKAEAVLASSATNLIKLRSEAALTAAEVAGYTATLDSVKAEIQLENVRLKAQINDVGRAATVQRMAVLRGELTAATAALSRVEASHTAVLAAEATATNAATAATANYTRAAAAATLGARAMSGAVALGSGAMALIGGPAGFAILAAAGLYAFREELGLIDTAAKDAAEEIDNVTKAIKGVDRAATEMRINALTAQLKEMESQAALAAKEWNNFDPSASMVDGLNMAQAASSAFAGVTKEASLSAAKVKAAKDEITRLNGVLGELDKSAEAAESGVGGLAEANERLIQSQIDAASKLKEEAAKIQEKINLLKQENDLLRLGYDLDDAKFIAAYANADALTQALMRQQREQQGIIDGYQAEIDILKAVEDAQKEATDAAAKLAEENKRVVDAFLDAEFGSGLVEGFNDASKALASFVDGFGDLINAQEKYNEAREAAGTDAVKLASIESKHQKDQVGLYGDMASSSKRFFDEGSKGYKALQAAEVGFRTIELAMAAKSAIAKGVNAVLTQGEGDPYTAPARMAAMAGVVAALGVAINGMSGGGGSSYQMVSDSGISATGGVLGDANESATSISNSLETLADLADAQLGYTAQMAQSLRNIESGMVGLTAEFAAIPSGSRFAMTGTNSVGSVLNGEINAEVGSQQLDMANFLSGYGTIGGRISAIERAAEEQAINQETLSGLVLTNDMQRIMNGMIETVEEGFGIIGRSAEGVRDTIKALDLPDLVIGANMSADEISEKLEDFFSNVGDGIIENIIPSIALYQQGGETLLDTFSRVVGQTTVLKDLSSSLGISLDSELITSIGNSLSLAAGGFSELSTNVNDFLDFTLTDAEQFARMGDNVTALFDGLGESLPGTRDSVADLVRALDLTTDAGQRAFTTITGASDLLEDYYSQLEDYTKSAYDFDTALGLNDGRKELREALAAVGHNLDVVETAAMGGVSALAELFGGLTDVEKAGLEPFTDSILNLIPATADASNGLAEMQRQMERLGGIAKNIRQYLDGLNYSGFTGTPEQQVQAAFAELQNLSADAYAGDADAAARLTGVADQVLRLGETAYASGAQFQSLFDSVKTMLTTVADNTDFQTIEELQLGLMQNQLDALDGVIAGITDQKIDQLNLLSTINTGINNLGQSLTVELTATATSEIEKLITFVTDTDGFPADLQELALSTASTLLKTVDYLAGSELPADLKLLALTDASTLAKTANYIVGSQLPADLKELALAESSEFSRTVGALFASNADQDAIALALTSSNALESTVNALLASGYNQQAVDVALMNSNSIIATVDALLAAGYDQSAFDLAFATSSTISKAINATGGTLTADQQAILNALNGSSNVTLDGDVLLRTDATMGDLLNAIIFQTQATAAYLSSINSYSSTGVGYANTMNQWLFNIANGYSTVKVASSLASPMHIANDYESALYVKSGGNALTVTSLNQTGSNLSKFALGGAFTNSIVNKPTTFDMGLMGEAGPEAIMPLHRGANGSLGVRGNAVNMAPVVAAIDSHRQETAHQTKIQAAAQKQVIDQLKSLNTRVNNLESEQKTARLVRS